MGLDTQFMRRAIASARKNPACPFGAVLVECSTGEVVAEGFNRTDENPTWHGEIDVINRFASQRARSDWVGLDLYTTAEPCPMCQAAILWAGIPRVIYGTSIAKLQALGWDQIDIFAGEVARRTPFAQCELRGGVLRRECDALFASAIESRASQPCVNPI